MSRRTAAANKAIRLAWETEQELVREGKGTRDWTKKQQQDILDPDKGKAYDDMGRAFEGQHMKSVGEYPEYQGNPDNIQFLTKDEHLEAHQGSWQNPTNWYYDPVTKEFTDFGNGEIIPCKIIELSDPIVVISVTDVEASKTDKGSAEKEKAASKEDSGISKNNEGIPPDVKKQSKPAGKATAPKSSGARKTPKSESGFIKGLKNACRFIVEHPVESIEIAGVVIRDAVKIVSSISGTSNKNNNTYNPDSNTSPATPAKTDVATKVADIVERANRSSPHENDVTGHRQRYHTKNGVIWKDKAPYHRVGKDS